ncbi:MAG: hypothetical protein GX267_10495 [Fibrobacter sp.]|jgi:hypothetical protein|nr:hypothetical protein [Fibrobacter sp.]
MITILTTILLLLLPFCQMLCAQELLADTIISCGDFIDSLRKENGDGERENFLTMEQKLIEPPKLRYFIAGFGTSYFDNIGTRQLAYDFFLGRFWQLRDGFSVGAFGEILTEFEDAILLDATVSALYYPFYTFIMPFGSISLGPGYLRAHRENSGGIFGGLELGAISSSVFPFILMVSGRLDLLIELKGNRGLPLPLVYSLRIGTAF